MKVNALCLAGAGLGLISLFLPWWSGSSQEYSLVQDVLLRPEVYSSGFLLSATLFVVGTGIAFLSPMGGLVQLPGALGFLALFNQEIGTGRGSESFEFGVYIGLVGAIVTMVSLLVPIGVGYGLNRRAFWKSLSSANRFLTVGWYDDGARARVNLLAFAGAVIAFACIALPWTTVTTVPPATEATFAEHTLLSFLDGERSSAGAYVFIIGATASVVTTFGAFAQLGGLIWLWWDLRDSMGINSYRFPWGQATDEVFGLGFYVGIIAIVVVAVSILLPLGIGYRNRKKSKLSRVLIWGRAGHLAY